MKDNRYPLGLIIINSNVADLRIIFSIIIVFSFLQIIIFNFIIISTSSFYD